MSASTNTNRVESGSDYDFWRINLPVQSRQYKHSSEMPVNILPKTGNLTLRQGGATSQSVVR